MQTIGHIVSAAPLLARNAVTLLLQLEAYVFLTVDVKISIYPKIHLRVNVLWSSDSDFIYSVSVGGHHDVLDR